MNNFYQCLIVNIFIISYFVDQSGVLASIRLLLGRGESGHPHLLGILPDFR